MGYLLLIPVAILLLCAMLGILNLFPYIMIAIIVIFIIIALFNSHSSKESSNNTKTSNAEPINDIIKCPHCNSNQIIAGTRGYSLLTGLIGANNTRLVCAKCGHKWKPGRKF